MPDELAVQIERIKEVVRTLNIPILDWKATRPTTCWAPSPGRNGHGVPVHIITGDRDLLQLVDDNTRVELPAPRGDSAEVYDANGVVPATACGPIRWWTTKPWSATSATTSPACKGIGDKTAIKLLAEYGTLDNLYAHLDDIKGALAKSWPTAAPRRPQLKTGPHRHRRPHQA
jgi:DNA polymerase-1